MANPLFPPSWRLARCLHQLEIISASEKVSEADCINYRSLAIFPEYLFAQTLSDIID